MTEQNRTLIYSIIKFLKAELNSNNIDDASKEGLAIGIECLETAYGCTGEALALTECAPDLGEVFEKYIKNQAVYENEVIKSEQKTEAEILKHEGNSFMSLNNFKEAISCYSKAIELDPKNPIYYCNRAASLNSFGNHDTAIEDCRTALKYDPLYHKAYARMGVALKAKNQLLEARDSFKKALQLQPENENYEVQLKDIEQALRNSSNCMINLEINGASTTFPLGNFGNDFANILNMADSVLRNRNPL